ncbi:hypothetical protein ACFQ34_10225, partial [Pseudonocardia benzenivorans]
REDVASFSYQVTPVGPTPARTTPQAEARILALRERDRHGQDRIGPNVPRDGPGRPRKRPERVVADKA